MGSFQSLITATKASLAEPMRLPDSRNAAVLVPRKMLPVVEIIQREALVGFLGQQSVAHFDEQYRSDKIGYGAALEQPIERRLQELSPEARISIQQAIQCREERQVPGMVQDLLTDPSGTNLLHLLDLLSALEKLSLLAPESVARLTRILAPHAVRPVLARSPAERSLQTPAPRDQTSAETPPSPVPPSTPEVRSQRKSASSEPPTINHVAIEATLLHEQRLKEARRRDAHREAHWEDLDRRRKIEATIAQLAGDLDPDQAAALRDQLFKSNEPLPVQLAALRERSRKQRAA